MLSPYQRSILALIDIPIWQQKGQKTPIDAQQHPMLDDITHALTLCGYQPHGITFFVADTMDVSLPTIVLPALPAHLTGQQKRQLWRLIVGHTAA